MDLCPQHIGVMAALAAELGDAAALGQLGHPFRVTTAVSGVGKVAAAREATRLILSGVDLILVVGTCGGLRPSEKVGDLVHLAGAIQWDLAVRDGRDVQADLGVSALWQGVASGRLGTALTADRPAIRWLSRARRAREFLRSRSHEEGAAQGRTRPPCPVADMETAAIGAVAESFSVPWAGLRVISDARRSMSEVARGHSRAAGSFKANFARVAGLPAASLPALLEELEELGKRER